MSPRYFDKYAARLSGSANIRKAPARVRNELIPDRCAQLCLVLDWHGWYRR
jgi:hypothetical protein